MMDGTQSAAGVRISLILPVPPTVNLLFATVRGRRVKSANGKAYEATVAQKMLEARCKPFQGDVGVRMIVYRARKIGDLDNFTKALLDSLKGGCWKDDKQVVYIESHRADDKDNPRVEIEIWEITERGIAETIQGRMKEENDN